MLSASSSLRTKPKPARLALTTPVSVRLGPPREGLRSRRPNWGVRRPFFREGPELSGRRCLLRDLFRMDPGEMAGCRPWNRASLPAGAGCVRIH
jgi:hypothetical protein